MDDPYPHDFLDRSVGITFHLPSRRQFIPNSWLLHADLNEKGTELHLHYTQWLVTITGIDLNHLHDRVATFGVSWVREVPTRTREPHPVITRIEITEKAD
jgi:hypothetical protein